MSEPDREHIKRLIQETPEEIMRVILMMMLTLLDRQEDDRTDLETHQREEEKLLRAIASDPEIHHAQHEYIAAAMEAQASAIADRAALRKAIIEKSLSGLVWAFLVFAGSRIWNLAITHWPSK